MFSTKKKPTIEICYIIKRYNHNSTSNLHLPRVQSLTSLITQIQLECSVQVKAYSQSSIRLIFCKLIFSDYNIKSLVNDIDLMLADLKTLNDVFSREGYDLDNIFEKLQSVSNGNLSEDEASPVELSGNDDLETRKRNDPHKHYLFKKFWDKFCVKSTTSAIWYPMIELCSVYIVV